MVHEPARWCNSSTLGRTTLALHIIVTSTLEARTVQPDAPKTSSGSARIRQWYLCIIACPAYNLVHQFPSPPDVHRSPNRWACHLLYQYQGRFPCAQIQMNSRALLLLAVASRASSYGFRHASVFLRRGRIAVELQFISLQHLSSQSCQRKSHMEDTASAPSEQSHCFDNHFYKRKLPGPPVAQLAMSHQS
ncbi:uncharacterized protein EI97DRAFT_282292 [Westerdykella ornata]|uniref:Uncharacterized protein n=1 Tax=Westerdykella ornata TaxID=318751 RepID=A0A6A6JP59_WESOR|nr:uncharacterized protein EI97DRAFT_282292 [Westerdykella ornata]KAF2278054.1 hypothetical protein EI97DRAFT_282292 [Westerdykella ornata]